MRKAKRWEITKSVKAEWEQWEVEAAHPRKPKFDMECEVVGSLGFDHPYLNKLLLRYVKQHPKAPTNYEDYSFPEISVSDLSYSEYRAIQIYNCPRCAEKFKHNIYWIGICPTCKAKEMNEENNIGFVRARSLGLSSFKTYKERTINTFSTSGPPIVKCSWECNQCGNTAVATLRDMKFMTLWQASCPVCVRGPRYTALIRSRQNNQRQKAVRLACLYGLRVLDVTSPDPYIRKYDIKRCGLVWDGAVLVTYTCFTCANVGKRSLEELKQGRACSCQKGSSGENIIMHYLKNRGVSFIREYSLSRLGLEVKLRFDFYIEDQQLAIEYDGAQHFKPVAKFGGEEGFMKRKENDILKNELAANAGIRVLRIPFDCQDIGSFLDHHLISQGPEMGR